MICLEGHPGSFGKEGEANRQEGDTKGQPPQEGWGTKVTQHTLPAPLSPLLLPHPFEVLSCSPPLPPPTPRILPGRGCYGSLFLLSR